MNTARRMGPVLKQFREGARVARDGGVHVVQLRVARVTPSTSSPCFPEPVREVLRERAKPRSRAEVAARQPSDEKSIFLPGFSAGAIGTMRRCLLWRIQRATTNRNERFQLLSFPSKGKHLGTKISRSTPNVRQFLPPNSS